jgi:hypothetical protein
MSEREVTPDDVQALVDELKQQLMVELPPGAASRAAPVAAAVLAGVVGALIGRSLAKQSEKPPALGALLGGLGGAALGLFGAEGLRRALTAGEADAVRLEDESPHERPALGPEMTR